MRGKAFFLSRRHGLCVRQFNGAWIAVRTIHKKLVVQVRASGVTGATDVADNLTLLNALALGHVAGELRHVQVLGYKLFAVLQHGKRVRGTPLDVFGYTRERRSERRFLKQYEQDVARIISELNADNADIALQILALPDEVRGFGPVKHAAMATAQARRKTLWQEFDAPKPLDLTTAA